MKDSKTTTLETTNEIAQQLLSEDALTLFLPAACQGLKDSNYERYLDCKVPEAAICLVGGRKAGIAIGDGCDWLPLMVTNGASLRFTSAARNVVPSKMEFVLREQFEQLAGSPNQGFAAEFVEWLYAKRPTNMRPVLGYFLSKPNGWLIGLPPKTKSRYLFSEPPLYADDNVSIMWYELRHLRIGEACGTHNPSRHCTNLLSQSATAPVIEGSHIPKAEEVHFLSRQNAHEEDICG